MKGVMKMFSAMQLKGEIKLPPVNIFVYQRIVLSLLFR